MIPFRPGRLLLTAVVLGFAGLDILAHGVHDGAAGMEAAGIAFLLPSLVVGACATRWIVRAARAFFS